MKRLKMLFPILTVGLFAVLVSCTPATQTKPVTELTKDVVTFERFHDGVLYKWPEVKESGGYLVQNNYTPTQDLEFFCPMETGTKAYSFTLSTYSKSNNKLYFYENALPAEDITIEAEKKSDGKYVIKFKNQKFHEPVTYYIYNNSYKDEKYLVAESDKPEIEITAEEGLNTKYYASIRTDNRTWLDFDKSVELEGSPLPTPEEFSITAKRQSAVVTITKLTQSDYAKYNELDYCIGYKKKGSSDEYQKAYLKENENTVTLKNLESDTEYEYAAGTSLHNKAQFYFSSSKTFKTQAPITEKPVLNSITENVSATGITTKIVADITPISEPGTYKCEYRCKVLEKFSDTESTYDSNKVSFTANKGNDIIVRVYFVPEDEPEARFYADEEKELKLEKYVDANGIETLIIPPYQEGTEDPIWGALNYTGSDRYFKMELSLSNPVKKVYFLAQLNKATSEIKLKVDGELKALANSTAYFSAPDKSIQSLGHVYGVLSQSTSIKPSMANYVENENIYNNSIYIKVNKWSNSGEVVAFLVE